jgi:hypothetical protein
MSEPSIRQLRDFSNQNCGRLPGLYTYETVLYRNKEYAVITIQHKKNEVRFVIDSCNLTDVLTKSWHLSSGKYIATHFTLPDGKSKEMFLHNFIKETCMNESADKVVLHINNNMLDNRSENLRIVTAAEHFPLRNNRKRTIILPPDCGFSADHIPKYVTFMKSNGEHGPRFAIEIPQLNICIKLPSSKKIPLNEKFEEAKEKLNELYLKYPHINPNYNDALKLELNTSFEEIVKSIEPLTDIGHQEGTVG